MQVRQKQFITGLAAALASACLWTSPDLAGAVPAAPHNQYELTQPDGETVDAVKFGDEWYHGFESVDGYTILRDGQTKEWLYAEKAAGGTLVPGDEPASEAAPDDLKKHSRDSKKLAQAESRAAFDDLPSNAPSPDNSGSQPSLVILAQLTNSPTLGTTPAQWSDRFFGPTGSVRDYYDEVSYGKLDMGPAAETNGAVNDGVVGWVSLARTHPGADAALRRETARDALLAADPFVDFAVYDTDGDGKIAANELHLTVVLAGYEEASCTSTPSVWGHNGQTYSVTPTIDGKLVGGLNVGDGGYSMFGEMHCSSGQSHMATIGIMAHEIGHDLDAPDLYNTATKGGGIGVWSLMASGSWARLPGQKQGTTPSHPDAFVKYYEGWTTPRKLSGAQLLGQVSTSDSVIRLGDNPGGVDWTFNKTSGLGEYFLVENRQKTGYDAGLPGCGLLIWHIDETRTSANTANADDARRLVDLEEKDNNENPRDAGDPFVGGSFTDSTTPNSRFYSGASSGLGVSAIDGQCSASMAATFTNSPQVAPANDSFGSAFTLVGSFVSRDSDTNEDATKEAGEPAHANTGGRSVWYQWTAASNGPVTIETVGSGFNTTLAVYTGTAVNSLQSIASNDDIQSGQPQSRISFPATAGVTYRIAVDGFNTSGNVAQGPIKLRLAQSATSPYNDNFDQSDELSGESVFRIAERNTGASRQSGEPLHAANAGGKSVWYHWTASLKGPVTIDTLGSDFDTTLAVYTGGQVNELSPIVSNDDVQVGTPQSSVTFQATIGTTYRIAVDGYNAGSGAAHGNFNLHLEQSEERPVNDDFEWAFPLAGASPTRNSDSNRGASLEPGEQAHAGNQGGQSIWYQWIASEDGRVTVDTAGSGFDTILAVYTGNTIGNLSSVVSNDDDPEAQVSTSKVVFDALAGTTYSIAVDGYNQGLGAANGTVALALNQPAVAGPTEPDTIIKSAPASVTTSNQGEFDFTASGEYDSFECRTYVSGATAWFPCWPVYVMSGISTGNHVFEVRAINDEIVDSTPARHDWMVNPVEAEPPGPSKACLAATTRVGKASKAVAKAKKNLKRAKKPAARKKASRNLRNAKSQLAAARRTQQKFC